MDLNILSELNELVINWEVLPEAEKLNTIRKLKKVGKLDTVEPPEEVNLQCPSYKFCLTEPCSLTSCPYNVDSSQDFNCLFHGLDRSKKGRMTINETSNYMDMPIPDINKMNTEAFLKIRKQVLKDTIEQLNPINFKYIEGHCVHCEEYIQEELDLNSEPGLVIDYGKFGWCSLECKEAKPEWNFRLERTYQTDYLTVLKTAYNLVTTFSSRTPEREVDLLLSLDNGTTAQYRRALRSM